MIPNHPRFLEALKDKKKASGRFDSKADNSVLDRVCAPIRYGPGENSDGLNRYWLWDYASTTGDHTLGLAPQQIVELQVLGEVFDPIPVAGGPSPTAVSPPEKLPDGAVRVPKL